MAREKRNIWENFIRISTDTYTEWDKDGCNYYWENKKWEKVKHNNAEEGSSNKKEKFIEKKEIECSRCHWVGKVTTRDGSYNSWFWDWRGSKLVTCPKCLWKWKTS